MIHELLDQGLPGSDKIILHENSVRPPLIRYCIGPVRGNPLAINNCARETLSHDRACAKQQNRRTGWDQTAGLFCDQSPMVQELNVAQRYSFITRIAVIVDASIPFKRFRMEER